MNRIFRGYLFVILSAILFGCLPLAANIAYDNGLNALSLVFYRNLFALPILYLPIRLRGEPLRISRQEFTNILPLSILGFCITPALLFTSYNYLPAGTSTTFHFIYPAMTILGGVVLFRQKVGWGRVFCVLLCSVGILLFYEPGGALDPFGSAIALASGVTYALYIILLDYFRLESLSRFKLSFYISATCAAVMLVVCLVTGTFRLPGNALCLGVCFLTAFLAGAAANVLFQNGTLIIGGQRASILSTFEPITSIVTGVLIFSDPFTLRSALGTVCVLAATVLIAVFDMRTQAQRQGAASTSSLTNPDGGSPAIREEHKGGSQ